MLRRKDRSIVPQTPARFLDAVRRMWIAEIPVTSEIALLSQELDSGFPVEPADRIIVATALARQAALVRPMPRFWAGRASCDATTPGDDLRGDIPAG